MEGRFYLLRIQLLDIEPAIWRRFVVPDCITLDRLHDVIQIVMGWTDSHLYEFIIGKKHYIEFQEFEDDGLPCSLCRLGDHVEQKNSKILYIYDYGDGWEHELVLEDNQYAHPERAPLLACLEGERACPPEDVGGVHGYFEFCNALKNPHHEEHKNCMAWSGGQYDMEKFDSGLVNFELARYLRWSRDRDLDWGYYE